MRREKLDKIETKLKILLLLLLLSMIASSALFITLFKRQENLNIVRAKGIIIEDENGKDRILIGAPIPFSKHRVRLDTTRVNKWWAKEFTGQEMKYMEWYRNYRHDMIGMVVMNSEGFDRILIGDSLADPNTGNRSFTLAGMVWNDVKGWERGGLGVNTTEEGLSRSIVGVDDVSGEAVHLVSMEDNTKGIIITHDGGRVIIGQSKKKNGKEVDPHLTIRSFNKKNEIIAEYPLSDISNIKK